MAVVPDVREPQSPQAPRYLRARTRGRTGPTPQSAVRPRIPRPPSSTARSPHHILKPGERIGADGSAQAAQRHRYGEPGAYGKYGWLPVTFLPGSVIYADSSAGSAGPQLLYQAIGAGNLRAYIQGADDVDHAALANLAVGSTP